MKKLILYIFFLLIWSNISFANEYILTCKSDKNFLTVYSINERLKKIIHLSSMSLISNQEFNDINYKEKMVSEKVMEITNNQGVPVVYDGVGKDTFDESIKSLSTRGLMVSFGQSSGMVEKIDMHKTFNPKSLFYTRPSLMGYTLNREELLNCANNLFEKMKNKEVKSNIYKKLKLEEAQKAHEILQSRKSVGSIILKP